MNNFHVIHDAKAKYPPYFPNQSKVPPYKSKIPANFPSLSVYRLKVGIPTPLVTLKVYVTVQPCGIF